MGKMIALAILAGLLYMMSRNGACEKMSEGCGPHKQIELSPSVPSAPNPMGIR